MKIKHWQGYGSVTATKLSKRDYKDFYGYNVCDLVIEVKGNHEWGLEVNDTYTLYNWLVKKFDKRVKDYNDICCIHLQDRYVFENNECVEVCEYTIKYKI